MEKVLLFRNDFSFEFTVVLLIILPAGGLILQSLF